MKPLNPMQQHLKVIAAHDLGDAMDLIVGRANPFGTALSSLRDQARSGPDPNGHQSLSQERANDRR